MLLDLVLAGEVLDDPFVDLHPEFGSDDLTAPEVHHDLGLVALFNEAVDIPDLELKIMFTDLGSDLHLFDIDGLPLCVLLMELILIFAEIKDLANRRDCRGRYFYKVKIPLFSNVQGVANGHDAKLAAVAVNDPDLLRSDLLVYSDVLSDVPVTDVFTSWS